MRRLAVVVSSFMLLACSSSEHEDLRQWMTEVSKDMKGSVPPLPQVTPYEPVPYDAANLVDPFKATKLNPEQKSGSGGGKKPDYDRPREPLESYPLESLKYVGVLVKKMAGYAIVQVDGALFQVKVGNYMGQNFGVITKITDTEVSLRELVQDPAGDWAERSSTLLLQESGAKK
jgi:type IV pilus assembly protein PilP